MFTRPDGLSDAQLAEVLASAWALQIQEIEYLAVGFGSFHWRLASGAEPWFVSVDDLETRKRHEGEPVGAPLRRLSAALRTAWTLREAGLDFIIAPIRTSAGGIVETVDDRFAVALYPFVDGTPHSWGSYPSRGERLELLNLLARLHAATELARPSAFVEDFTIAHRAQLIAALADMHHPWETGPFGERTRELVALHAEPIRRALALHDRLASRAGRPERMVVTHGEPHRANTITTKDGVVLIDWDTLLIAPPERDPWALDAEDPSIGGENEARTGTGLSDQVMELYRLSWDISEIATYVEEFRRRHEETADSLVAVGKPGGVRGRGAIASRALATSNALVRLPRTLARTDR